MSRSYVSRGKRLLTSVLTTLGLVCGVLSTNTFVAAAPAAAAPASALCAETVAPCVPPDLINPWLLTNPSSQYSATDAQRASLKALQAQAITTVLHDHGLPATDRAAVQSWGRAEAEAELWNIIYLAFSRAADTRTPDEQNAVSWLMHSLHNKAVADADAAGWEYLKWAGLLSGTGPMPSHTALLSLIDQAKAGTLVPVAYNTDPRTTSPSSGFCAYRPPAPMQNGYTGNVSTPATSSTADSWCYPNYVCLNPLGCRDNAPSFQAFVAWGEAESSGRVTNTAGYATAMAQIVESQIFSASVVATGAAAGLGLASAAMEASVGAAIASELMPFLTGISDFAVTAASGAQAVTAAAAGEGVLSADAAGSIAVGAVGAAVAVIIIAIAIAVIQGIQVAAAANLPGKMHDLLTNAADSAPDPKQMIADPGQRDGLFAVFVGATMPMPTLATCDNNPLVSSGVAPPAVCLNAPSLPAPTYDDPQFLVTPQGGVATRSDTMEWTDGLMWPVADLTQHKARLHGSWLIDDSVTQHGHPLPTTQRLRFHYIDRNLRQRVAWVVKDNNGRYKFVSMVAGYAFQIDSSQPPPPLTAQSFTQCRASQTCLTSDSIEYLVVDSTGQNYHYSTASIVDRVQPIMSVKMPDPTEGTPATFSASSDSPLTFQWYFKPYSPPQFCASGQQYCGYSGPFNGSSAAFTWGRPGTYDAILIGTDGLGRQLTKRFVVTVAAVPTTLTAAPGAPVTLPAAATVSGTIGHAGSQDSGTLSIDWGDGTSDTSPWGDGAIIMGTTAIDVQRTSAAEFSYTAGHKYPRAGDYTAKVTLTDETGATSSVSVTKSIYADSVTTLVAGNAKPFIDERVILRATVSAADGTPTGSVTFADDQGNTICASVPLTGATQFTAECATNFSAAATHAIRATYGGAPRIHSSVSSPLSIDVAKLPTQLVIDPATPVVGRAITLTARVNGDNPTGTVTFTDGGADLCRDLIVALDRSVHCSAVFSLPGDHELVARYSGDARNAASDSPTTAMNVARAPSQITITDASQTATFGQQINLTATVSVAGVEPTGAVTFYDGSDPNPLCTAAITSIGTLHSATCTTTLSGGTHSIVARYAGDRFATASASNSVVIAVNRASTTTTVTVAPGRAGAATVLTATVHGVNGIPTGTATFTEGGTVLCAAVPLSAASPYQASCSHVFSQAGSHPIIATYSGDGNYADSTSAATPAQIPFASAAWLLSSTLPNPMFGRPLGLMATATPATGLAAPSGTIQFHLDGKAVGAPAKLAGNRAISANLAGLAPGLHKVDAIYSGDSSYGSTVVASTVLIGCARTISTSTGPIASISSLCLSPGAVVKGSISISGGALSIQNATVLGNIASYAATAVRICGSTIKGSVEIVSSLGPVIVGNGTDCAGSTINGSLTTLRNRGGVTIAGNVIGRTLSCAADQPAPSHLGRPNRVAGKALGQCASLVYRPSIALRRSATP